MSSAEDEYIHIKIKEKPAIEWSNQIVIKVDSPDGTQSPETEKSPILTSCMKTSWSSSSNLKRPLSPRRYVVNFFRYSSPEINSLSLNFMFT